MTLPEIVIEENPSRVPRVLLVVAWIVALAPVAFFTFVNMIFWGFSNGEGGLYTVGFFVLPIVWVLAGVALLLLRKRPIRLRVTALVVLALLIIADAFVIIPLFVG